MDDRESASAFPQASGSTEVFSTYVAGGCRLEIVRRSALYATAEACYVG
jgi:hypothetical protein